MTEQRDDDTAVEEELDDTEQDGEETEAGDDDEQGEPEWTPPTREQWEAQQAKLARARKQAQTLREKSKAGASAPAADPEAAAAAQADVERWQARAVRTAAKAELLARGADPDMVELALSRLKVAQVEFDDDDQPDLEDWLDDTQDRYPKLFKQAEQAPAPTRPKAGKVETPTGRPVRPKPTLGEQILANSLGANGRRRG